LTASGLGGILHKATKKTKNKLRGKKREREVDKLSERRGRKENADLWDFRISLPNAGGGSEKPRGKRPGRGGWDPH